jgi:hypothetical protein
VAKLKRIVAVGVADADLAEVAAELRGPIRLAHPDLGTLEYDRRYDWFSGRSVWCGEIVEVSLSGDPDAPEAVAAAASRLFSDQAGWDRRVRDFAVERLLPLKNDVWLGEDEPELAREDFLARMTLTSIDVDESGSFTFWHSDGDLFGGHSIQVSGNLDSGPTAVDIPG